MKKVIVTGGNGFIGSNLIKFLIQKNYFVINIDKNKYSKNSYILKDLNIQDLEVSISNKIGLRVDIKNREDNKGKIVFEYKDLDQLNKIIQILKDNY